MHSSSRAWLITGLFTTVSLLGAGCGFLDSSSFTKPVINPKPTTTTTNTPSQGTSGAITTSSTLDTTGWQTYTNKTLGFSFQYPLRGSFAPQFEVKLLPLTTTDITNGCYPTQGLPGDQSQVTVNGVAFCKTHTTEGAAGSSYDEHYWVTTRGNWYVVLRFTKRYSNDPTVKPFDQAGYNNQIEAILSTLQFPS